EAHLVDLDHVAAVEPSHGLCFEAKALEEVLVRAVVLADRLQGNDAIEAELLPHVDRPHGPAADEGEDLAPADGLPHERITRGQDLRRPEVLSRWRGRVRVSRSVGLRGVRVLGVVPVLVVHMTYQISLDASCPATPAREESGLA